MPKIEIEGWVLVTGATGHLGQELILQIIEAGGRVFATDVPEKAESLFEIQASYPNAQIACLAGDLDRDEFVDELLMQVKKTAAPLMGLVNNAAYVGTSQLSGWGNGFDSNALRAWNSALRLNLTVPMILSYRLMDTFAEKSSIVNIASIYGLVAPSWNLYADTDMINPAAYGVSKAGLIQQSKWLSSVMASKTRVNTISPGGILRSGQDTDFQMRYRGMTHTDSMATESDVANGVIFLLSQLSSHVTGQNMVIDGGFSSS